MDDDKDESVSQEAETAIATLKELCGDKYEASTRLQAAQRLLAHAEWKADQ